MTRRSSLRIALYLFVPYTILSPFLGVVIDRWDRRRLLFLANGLRAVVILIMGLVTIDRLPDAVLFLAFLLTLTSTRIVLATKAAAIPATVGEDIARRCQRRVATGWRTVPARRRGRRLHRGGVPRARSHRDRRCAWSTRPEPSSH